MQEQEEVIVKFMQKYNEDAGWMLKSPFTTNSLGFKERIAMEPVSRKRWRDEDPTKISLGGAVRNALTAASNRSSPPPYLMMQPYMANNAESKMVMFDGAPLYLYGMCSSRRVNVDFAELDVFCRAAVERLRAACPYAITDGLLRVDVFRNKAGQLVVNEFESLEADHGPRSQHAGERPAQLQVSMEEYYAAIITDVLASVLKKNVPDKNILSPTIVPARTQYERKRWGEGGAAVSYQAYIQYHAYAMRQRGVWSQGHHAQIPPCLP